MTHPRSFRLVVPLVVLSGACALVYQIAWTRALRLVFGASTPASSAVVAVFVGGLGLGAWRLGAVAERTSAPLRVYAQLELGVAVSAGASPFLVRLAEHLYLASGGVETLGSLGAAGVRIALTTLVLGVPTFLMGGTLPVLSRAVVARSGDPARTGVALLYGMNTLGGFVGCVAANFAMLGALGTQRSIWHAAAANTLVGVIAFGLSRRAPEVPMADVDARAPADALAQAAPAPAPFVLGASAVVGFAYFLMELVFYRMLIPVLGGTVYTFGLVLATALLGIGIGGALYAFAFARQVVRLWTFATTCLLEAAGFALPYVLGDRLAILAIRLRPFGDHHGFAGYVAGWFVIAAIVVLPASIAAGAQFPMLVALLGRGGRNVGRHVGAAYAWNTVGAIAGALAGGFGLMSTLTAPGCWRFAVEILAATGALGAVLAWRAGERRLGVVLNVILAVSVVVAQRAALGPTAVWRHSPIGAGRVRADRVATARDRSTFQREKRRDIAWEADGLESSIGLAQSSGYAFMTNGKSDGHCADDAPTQVMGGLLGALLHPHPTSALVVGLGSGSSAGWLARVPSMTRVDVVELEPAMREVARRCAPVNEHALDNPKLHFVAGDAREVLGVSPARYDVIFSEPSNPYRAGVASLYTLEHYERARAHLEDHGILIQWLQRYEVDTVTVRSILRTLSMVFPHVEIWHLAPEDLALVASGAPIVKRVPDLRARIHEEPYDRALRDAWDVNDLEGVLAHFDARAEIVARALAGDNAPLNTDDRSIVEFGFAKNVGGKSPDLDAFDDAEWIRGDAPGELTLDRVDWPRVWLARAEGSGHGELPPGGGQELRDRAHDLPRPFDDQRLRMWGDREPANIIEELRVAAAAVGVRDSRAKRWIEALARDKPSDALGLRAMYFDREGLHAEAADAVEQAILALRIDPWVSSNISAEVLAVAEHLARVDHGLAPRMLKLLSEPFAIESSRDVRLQTALTIAELIDATAGCRDVLAPLEPNAPWQPDVLLYRARCYRITGDTRAAGAGKELVEFQSEEAEWTAYLKAK